MKRLLILLAVISGATLIYLRAGKTPATPRALDSSQIAQAVRSSSNSSIGVPARLKIPKLRIDTQIEQVGMDDDGRMGVPTSSFTAGWWKLGVRPGEQGSAVLAGHLDTPQGTPGVFWDLGKLKLGDEIMVTDAGGVERKFAVVDLATYADATFPINKVFAADDGKYLNLITCNGNWDKQAKNYDKRLVVFARELE